MSENDNIQSNETFFLDELEISLSGARHTIHSTINLKIETTNPEEEIARAQEEEANQNTFDIIELRAPLGEGGMGIVYSAQQFYPEREVAIKRLKSKRRQLIRGLVEEAMVMGKLTHPNIPPVHQLRLNEENLPEVVMKKIEGKTFQDILNRKPQREQGLKNSLHVLIQVCYAVEFAHSLGFLHRDLKPENIMVGAFNQVYLMDWGLAVDMNNSEKNRQGLAGTPAYMAPEMLLGDPSILTPASDIYLLGTILHEILVGEFRHKGRTVRESLQSVQKSESYVYDDEIPHLLTELCNQACALEPSERPQTVIEFRERLEEFLERWEVIKLIQKGIESFERYKELWNEEKQKPEPDYSALLNISQRAKFTFEQALESWPDSQEAKEGLMALLEVMIDQALFANEVQIAIFLFQDCPLENPSLSERVQRAKKEWEEEQERQRKLGEMERELDPSLTVDIRFFLQRFSFILSILVVAGMTVAEFLIEVEVTKEKILNISIGISIFLWISTFIFRHRLLVNDFGRRVVISVLSTSIAITFSRYMFVLNDAELYHLTITDCLLLGVTMACIYPALRSGLLLAILSLFYAVLIMILPEYCDEIFKIGVLSFGSIVYLEFRNERLDSQKLQSENILHRERD